jgi:phage shock protein A
MLTILLLQLSAPDDLESKFKQLEGSNVDDDLEAMRAKLGTTSFAGQVIQIFQ